MFMKTNKMLLSLALSCIAFINTVEAEAGIWLHNDSGKLITYRTSTKDKGSGLATNNRIKVASNFNLGPDWVLEIKGASGNFKPLTDYIKKASQARLSTNMLRDANLIIMVNPSPFKWNIIHKWELPSGSEVEATEEF